MADVFISYAREDKARADQVARGLQAMGLDVFWDTEIPPGSTWADFIEAKLSACKAAVVLWSAASTKSQWVREEARMGRDRGNLIPAMLDATPAPFGFGEVQAANLSDWNGQPDHPEWRRFAAAVTSAVGAPAPASPQPVMSAPPRAAPTPASQPAPAAHAKKDVPKWAWIAGAVAGVLVLLAGIGAVMDDAMSGSAPPAVPDVAQGVANMNGGQAQAPAAPQAGGSPQQVILAQLNQAQGALGQQGFQQLGQPFSGNLAQGQTFNVPIDLYAGVEYHVVGVCDADCRDLDLVLYDPNGQAVLQDNSTDDRPVLSLRPQVTARYMVQVQMFNCSVAPCYYALALYARQAGAG